MEEAVNVLNDLNTTYTVKQKTVSAVKE